jgi:hypothetical protein
MIYIFHQYFGCLHIHIILKVNNVGLIGKNNKHREILKEKMM